MGFEPSRVPYLALALQAGLGQMHPMFIKQVGARWQPLVSPFKILDDGRYNQFLRSLQTREAAIETS